MQDLFPYLLMLGNGIGQLAVIAILYGVLQRRRGTVALRSLLLAVLFASAGLVAMVQPLKIAPGAFVDLRGVVVGLAGAFGGWPAAALAAFATGLYRLYLGGHYLAGGSAILIAAAAGLLWRRWMRGRRVMGSRHFVVLGAMISLHAAPALFVTSLWGMPLTILMGAYFAGSMIGSIAFGKMIQREMRLITQERMLADEALQDPLTSLWNRRGFEREFLEARSFDLDAPLALMLIDIDFFKRVNDTLGHGVGDSVIVEVAARITQSLRLLDRASRHGGEEFAVLLPRTGPVQAVRLAEDLRRAIAGRPVTVAPGIAVGTTVSIGVAICADGRSSLKTMFDCADAHLYAAKTNGRNRVEPQRAAAPAVAAAPLADRPRRRAAASAR